jgi:hypothetical protein
MLRNMLKMYSQRGLDVFPVGVHFRTQEDAGGGDVDDPSWRGFPPDVVIPDIGGTSR